MLPVIWQIGIIAEKTAAAEAIAWESGEKTSAFLDVLGELGGEYDLPKRL